ncbi:MAG TPA: hypothetical protein VG228_05890 [Solirubrobacteraceae bacterium]|jgi:hypothetical protein|nr:hypothetical protein [Solirubrobacteraceae bacterium]
MTRGRSALVGLLIAAPFYWLLVDTGYEPDLIAGAVAVLIAAGAYSAAHLEPTASARIRLRWMGFALREIAKVPSGVLIVCREILAQTLAPRRARGVLEAEPFPAADGDAFDLGRRALGECFRSFAPNTVVIGVDPDSGRLIQHRIGPQR